MNAENFQSFDGTTLALHRMGEGRPVVLLHGLFSNADMNWIRFGLTGRIAGQGYEVLNVFARVAKDRAAPRSR